MTNKVFTAPESAAWLVERRMTREDVSLLLLLLLLLLYTCTVVVKAISSHDGGEKRTTFRVLFSWSTLLLRSYSYCIHKYNYLILLLLIDVVYYCSIPSPCPIFFLDKALHKIELVHAC